MIRSLFIALIAAVTVSVQPVAGTPPVADPATYLQDFGALCRVDWPKNRLVNVVCHGHSVPAGYFKTPEIRSLEAYPNQLRVLLAQKYPHAMINVIVTAIGGRNLGGRRRPFRAGCAQPPA